MNMEEKNMAMQPQELIEAINKIIGGMNEKVSVDYDYDYDGDTKAWPTTWGKKTDWGPLAPPAPVPAPPLDSPVARQILLDAREKSLKEREAKVEQREKALNAKEEEIEKLRRFLAEQKGLLDGADAIAEEIEKRLDNA